MIEHSPTFWPTTEFFKKAVLLEDDHFFYSLLRLLPYLFLHFYSHFGSHPSLGGIERVIGALLGFFHYQLSIQIERFK